jgi:hypothetical protein
MDKFKTFIASIAYEVCLFLSTKRKTSKVIKIIIDKKFEDYLTNNFKINRSRYRQVEKLISFFKLKKFFSHNTFNGNVKLTEFVFKLNKVRVIKIMKRKNEVSTKSPITLSIRMCKVTNPSTKDIKKLIDFDYFLRNRHIT